MKKYCTNCLLNTQIPGVTINDDGVCTFCASYEENKKYEKRLNRIVLKKMEHLFEDVKKQSHLYDAVVLFSGGKDSTYLLKLAAEEYKLRVLAISIIHPLVNAVAANNMEVVTKKLGIDLLKFQVPENIYKKVMRKGIYENEQYGLDEFFGCSICSFLHYWIPIRVAIGMDIPIILEGSDLGQTGAPMFVEGESMKQRILQGEKPYGRIHDLIKDALGEEYENSIYSYNQDELLGQKNYPTILSPFTILDYDYKKSLKEIDTMGFDKKAFSKIFTNCSLIPFLSYFTIQKYDCIPYIKQYANSVRRQYPVLQQLSLQSPDDAGDFNRTEIAELIEEYKKVILYVVENKLTREQILADAIETIESMAPTYLRLFGKEVGQELIRDVAMIPYYSEYFGVNI